MNMVIDISKAYNRLMAGHHEVNYQKHKSLVYLGMDLNSIPLIAVAFHHASYYTSLPNAVEGVSSYLPTSGDPCQGHSSA